MSHSIDLPAAESLRTVARSIARIDESLGVSQVRAMPFARIYQSLVCQFVESASSYIVFELSVPKAGIKFYEPGAEGRQILR